MSCPNCGYAGPGSGPGIKINAPVSSVRSQQSDLVAFVQHCIARFEHGPDANPNDGLLHDARAVLATLNATPSATSPFNPTHKHAEGGLYQVLGQIKVKAGFEWEPAVLYRNEEGMQFCRTEQEFGARFVPIARAEGTGA